MKDDILSDNFFNEEKWSEFLRRFIDVLRINIFVVDRSGRVIIPPYQLRGKPVYGSNFLANSFGFNLLGVDENFLDLFEKSGPYLETKNAFDLHVFAVPVKFEADEPLAYLLVGPVILNKVRDGSFYLNLASQLNFPTADLMGSIHEIRAVSFVTIKAILDLLSEVIKDMVQLSMERKRLQGDNSSLEVLSTAVAQAAQDIYAEIHQDELLVTILDLALSMTQAECGSIMIMDANNEEMTIRVSRGMNKSVAQNARLKVGEGIAGIAAQENSVFVISGKEGDNRIKHLLKRPEIRQAVVIPLAFQDRVLGVLNLHTRNDSPKLAANMENLKQFSKLISTAINSL